MIEKLLPHLDSGKPAITLDAQRRRESHGARFLPAYFQADALRLQRCGKRPGRDRPEAMSSECCAAHTCARSRNTRRAHFATEAVVISAQIESELVDLAEAEAAEYLRDLGVEGKRRRRAHSRGLSPSRAAHLPHDRRKGNARLDDSRRRQGAGRSGRDPFRFRARLHRGRDGALRRSGVVRLIRQGARSRQAADRGQGICREGRRRGRVPLQRLSRNQEGSPLLPLPAF